MSVSVGGDKRDRTADLLNAIQALSQLSYTPIYTAGANDHTDRTTGILADGERFVNYYPKIFRISRYKKLPEHPPRQFSLE